MKRYVIEHKTSSVDIGPGSSYWKRLIIDSQCSNYIEGAKSFGVNPDGVLYDVIKKVALRPYKATPIENRNYKKDGTLYANQRAEDESIVDYSTRVAEDIAMTPEKYFQRGVVVRLENEITEALADNWMTAQHVRESQNGNRWPRNPDACERYGRFCDYWVVCSGETRIENDLLFETNAPHEELDHVKGDAQDGKKRLPLLTTSAIKSYRRCTREYFYRYELGRKSRGDAAEALNFGTAMHKALEVWWTTVDVEMAINVLRAAFAAGDPFECVRAIELMRGYDRRWKNEPYNVLFVEKEFRMPLINPDTGQASRTWEMGGKIDAVAETER